MLYWKNKTCRDFLQLPLVLLLIVIMSLGGCTSYGVVENAPKQPGSVQASYSLSSYVQMDSKRDNKLTILLAFSGGGTRAAAFAYGVLELLYETRVKINGQSQRLIDYVDIISSVSGGSFTAAYYGVHGKNTFVNFKKDFLLQNNENSLIRGLTDPRQWFNNKTRTELAVDYFDETLFHGATFNNLMRTDGPLVVINTSDLGNGVRLSFLQEYFNLLCSDLSSFPVARAVVASAAVPLVFSPVVLRNYDGCLDDKPDWLIEAQARFTDNPEMSLVTEGLASYLDKDRRKFIHLVDGGITDNLGLRSIVEIIGLSGGIEQFMRILDQRPPGRVITIVVNASTAPHPLMDASRAEPSLEETFKAITDAQMNRYNAATLELMQNSQEQWVKKMSTAKQSVTSYFVPLRFKDLKSIERQKYINSIPTSLSLSEEQVNALIEAGHELLYTHPQFQQFLVDIAEEAKAR